MIVFALCLPRRGSRAGRLALLALIAQVGCACHSETVAPGEPITATPTTVWRIAAPGGQGVEIPTPPATTATALFALAPRGNIVSLNDSTGGVIWSAPRGGGSAAPNRLLVAENRIIWAGDTVNGLDTGNGARAWTYAPTSTTAGCDPSVAGDLFIVCTRDWNVVALRAATGEPVWTLPLRDSLRGVPRLTATASSGDTVYALVRQDYSTSIGFSAARIFLISRQTGSIISTIQEGNYTDFTGDVGTPTVAGDLLILSHILLNRLTAINRFTKRVVWRVNGDPGWAGFQLFGPLSVSDGISYAASADRRVYAVTAESGTVRWKSEILDGSQTAAAVCGPFVFTWTGVNVRILSRSTGAYLGLVETGPSPAYEFSTRPVARGNALFLESAAEFRKLTCGG